MKYDYHFATQYKECFVYFGIQAGASETELDNRVYSMGRCEQNNQVCTMGGCVATFVEVDKEDSYIWSSMPQLGLQSYQRGDVVKLCGGYTYGNEIKLLATFDSPRYGMGNYITKCWTTSLATPSLHWSEVTSPIILPTHIKGSANTMLVAVKRCKQYIIYFYTPKKFGSLQTTGLNLIGNVKVHAPVYQSLSPMESFVIVIDEEKNRLGVFSTDHDSFAYDGYISCAVVGADLFIVMGNKMTKVERFSSSLVASADTATKISISFDLNVPHANSTLFVIQDSLCVMGGCDEDYDEPFSDIYQFDQETHNWSECGVCAMARYGASVVPFTDRYKKEAVFIAGGFKAKGVPCTVIEVLSVTYKS